MDDRLIRNARWTFLLSWPLLAGMLVALLGSIGSLPWSRAALVILPPSALFTLACLSSWYVVKTFPLRGGEPGRILLTHIAAGGVLSTLWVGAVAAWSFRWTGLDPIRPLLPLLFGLGILFYLLAVAFFYLVQAVQQSQEGERRAGQARLLARESELKALKAQINPHFLFNSLHSISALTSGEAAKARRMCILLADFLRTTLRLGNEPRIPLDDEIELARQYLSIEQVRFTDRLRVEEAIDRESLRCLVPSLLLQPLVENAVKHGIATLTEPGTVRLATKLDPDLLSITLENDFDPEAPSKHTTGIGLSNVRDRLRTAYGSGGALEARAVGGRWRVDLRLPVQKGDAQ